MEINLLKINMRDLVSNLNHADPLVTFLLLAVAVAWVIYQMRKYQESCHQDN